MAVHSRLLSAISLKSGLTWNQSLRGLLTAGKPETVLQNFPPVQAKRSLRAEKHFTTLASFQSTPRLIKGLRPRGSVKVVSVTRKEYELPPDDQTQRDISTGDRFSQASNEQNVNDTMIEAAVCKVGDIEDGQMKEVELGDNKVLIVKDGGQFYAVGSKCTHYGASLSKGAYCKGVVRCPWHGACFNVKTGDIEDFPGLDSIHSFQVEVRGEDVVVKADPAALQNFRRVKPMVKKAVNQEKSVVIVGGGPASVIAAETLRQEGFTGKITIVSKETSLPYDRIKLSKAMGVKAEEIALRSAEFYSENGIELILGKEVTKVEAANKKIQVGQDCLSFDFLFLATGGQPRKLPIPGADLNNVFLLRTPADANAIAEAAKGKNVVILGTSFIGMEVTAFLADKAASVNCVDLVITPFLVTLGEQLGLRLKEIHEGKGVKFHLGTTIEAFTGEGGQVSKARLANGIVLDADVCVMGVGVVPSTSFLKDSGIGLTERGFVSVDKHMKTNVPDVYAGGDIVEFPLFTVGDKSANVQHWQMAHQHGRIAALSIVGKAKDIRSVPYFWTVQYGMSIRYAGYGIGHDDIVLHGDLSQNKFVAYYTKGDVVVAIASLGWDPIVSQAAELMQKGGSISKDEISLEPSTWTSRLRSS